MIDELLKVGGAKFLVPCILAVAIVWLAKGLFGVHQSRRVARKDFLDVWVHKNDRDELWQQTAIRHLFGAWLPMPVIRQLMISSESGNALVEICRAWEFLEFDDNTLVVSWKAKRYRKPSFRRWEINIFKVLYWFFNLLMILSFFYALNSNNDSFVSMRWVFAFEMVIFFLGCLTHHEDLSAAHKAVPRLLGIP